MSAMREQLVRQILWNRLIAVVEEQAAPAAQRSKNGVD